MDDSSKELATRQALDGVDALTQQLAYGDLDDGSIVDAARSYIREVLHPLVEQVHASQDPVVDAAFRAHRTAVAARSALLAPFLEAEARIKKALGIREKALREREESARNAIEIDDLSPTLPVTVTTIKGAGISARRKWTWKVTDLSQMKREFLIANPVEINKAVRKHGKNAEAVVGGILVEEDTPNVTVRRK
jgi:hypothetical protein